MNIACCRSFLEPLLSFRIIPRYSQSDHEHFADFRLGARISFFSQRAKNTEGADEIALVIHVHGIVEALFRWKSRSPKSMSGGATDVFRA